jgi:hypothetical protein
MLNLISSLSIWLLGAFNIGLVIYAMRPLKDEE